jgi:hypothetical protein
MPYPYFLFDDLQKISKAVNGIQLGFRQYELLQDFVEAPGTWAYKLGPVRENEAKNRDYRNTKNRIQRLHKLNLIEKTRSKRKDKKIPYRLSKYGVYYLLASQKILGPSLLTGLFKNYGGHLLFQLLLYPYVKLETLIQIIDSGLLQRIVIYLHECCKKLNDTIYDLSHTLDLKEKYVYACHHEKLVQVLKEEFGWDWLEKADIRQNEDEKWIEVRISDRVNYALISIDKNRDKATLRFKQKWKRMSKEHHLKNTNRFILKRPAMTMSSKQLCVYLFLIFCQARVPELIYSMISDYGTRSPAPAPALKILGQDDMFMQALKKTRDDFEKRYQLILGK